MTECTDLEKDDDELEMARDAERNLKRKAAQNPSGWEAKFLKAHNGHVPVFRHYKKDHEIMEKIEQENLKILSRW